MTNPPHISVVDDDESIRQALRGSFRSTGFAVNVFPSAEEFLNSDHLRDTDCLILDMCMPGMDGMELYRRLIADHFGKPVIFITAHGSNQEMRARAMRNGAFAYLDKPLNDDALLEAVRKALNLK